MPDTIRDAAHEVLEKRWKEAGDKVVALADDFAESDYASRPAEGMRTFAEQLRHVAFWNAYAARTLRGEPADGSANELPAALYPSKATIVKALRDSVDDVWQAFDGRNGSTSAGDVDTLVSYIAHMSEHYGQLVAYCRARGVVPPASR